MLLDEFEFIDIEDLLDETSPDEVPGCPAVLVKKHLRQALRIFCRRSGWWRATLDPITLAAGVSGYSLEDVPDDVQVASIEWVKINGRTLPSSEYGISDDNRELLLATAPVEKVVGGLVVRARLVPTKDCARVGSHLVDEWSDPVSAGALARLRRIPNKPWTDINLSILNTQTFEAGIARARNAAIRERKNEDINVVQRRFSV